MHPYGAVIKIRAHSVKPCQRGPASLRRRPGTGKATEKPRRKAADRPQLPL